jgi:hypothetical protein
VGREARGFPDRAVGPERSPGLARLARENARCPVLEADFTVFDFSPFWLDGILLVGVFVQVPHRELPALLSRCAASLNPGGLVLSTLKEGERQATDGKGRRLIIGSSNLILSGFRDNTMSTCPCRVYTTGCSRRCSA